MVISLNKKFKSYLLEPVRYSDSQGLAIVLTTSIPPPYNLQIFNLEPRSHLQTLITASPYSWFHSHFTYIFHGKG